ncbi:GPO family capsid scaffolding protein [Photobacterium sanguinicancri]|uniref:GPO family capsid scaffolding protein n=1 Tax=Photobacterium sanguinicancri TaxID=875932 RepID=UPI00247FC50C|nr:GPO family capsid scaffolding protein [Photobacterium sanguinicancri]
MPKHGQLKTEWIRVATEGQTIDGRTITREWIDQMAETYSTDEYIGLVWPEHRRFNWFEGKDQDNWGEVVDVKSGSEGGKRRLYVTLRPNSQLLLANEKGQKLFTSIEIDPDFCESGKCYLVGIAVTDRPASTGTTRLQFSANKSQEVTELEPLELEFQFTEQVRKSFVTRFISMLFGEEQSLPENHLPDKDDETMKTEQFNALTESLTKLAEGQAALQTTLQSHFSQDDSGDGGELPPKGKIESDNEPLKDEGSVTAEQFSELTGALTKLADGQTAMQQQFSKLLEEGGDQRPDLSGGSDDFDSNSLV